MAFLNLDKVMSLFTPPKSGPEGRPDQKKPDSGKPEQSGGSPKDNRPPKSPLMRGFKFNQNWNNLATALFIALAVVLTYSILTDREEIEEISLSRLATDISAGEVESITVRSSNLEIFYFNDIERQSRKEDGVSLTEILTSYGVTANELRAVEIDVQRPGGFGFWLLTLGPFILPLILILLILWFILRQAKGAGMQAFTFGQSRARMIMPGDKNQQVTFADVAGAKEAKEELSEIVEFLKNPKKFINIGAKIPKGILLMGPPGSGKTLLARAVAGEAKVAFFSISGSEFVEMFVGVGASRTRDLFKMAKQASPAIIFIDELDAIGRVRGTGVGGGNDEREQTLNQILVEMDGFEPNERLVIMAATNRPDVLDPALLRPGRFDRRVTVDLPDKGDREAILKVQARQVPLGADVDFAVIAERTPGFSGAELYSLVNEAAILAARQDQKEISQSNLIQSIEKVMLGPERRSHILSKQEKKITAYHEAGHALVASVLPNSDPVHKVSIISRGRAAGYTLKLPDQDRKLQSRREFIDDIAVSLAGYVTEKMVFGDLTTGPSNDLQVSTALARNMITRYGMSEKMGPVALESASGQAIFGTKTVDQKEYSERISAEIDAEVSSLINQGVETAEKVISEYRHVLDAIAERLIEVENLERAEYEEILKAHGIDPQKPDYSGEFKNSPVD